MFFIPVTDGLSPVQFCQVCLLMLAAYLTLIATGMSVTGVHNYTNPHQGKRKAALTDTYHTTQGHTT